MLSSDDLAHFGLISAAVLAVLLVALSTYGRRTLHPALRSFVWVASNVFLPLTSSVISSLLRKTNEKNCKDALPIKGSKNPDVQTMWTLLLWIALILVIKGNADTAAAGVATVAASPSSGDVSIDGQKVRPPVENLAQYAWLAYLIVMCIPVGEWLGNVRIAIFIAFCVLGFAKMALKVLAFWSAGSSFALGKNARLISGYMAQLVEDGEEEGHEQVPRYIVMGERKKHVYESPHGYRIKRAVLEDKFSSLVTLDRVWRLSDHGDGLLAERRELRDLCLSYSLFKSIRRRLSGYPLADAAGSSNAIDFVLRGMNAAGVRTDDADRVFRVLVDELGFASDFYYSSLPLCSLSGWCAALNHLFSVLIVVGAVTVGWIYHAKKVVVFSKTPLYYIITFSLLLAVVLTETWEIVADVCSNWTKMALLGHYIRRESLWRRTRCAQAALAAVLRFRPARRWRDKIGQNTVLEPRRFRKRSGLLSEQLYGRAGLMRSVEVLPAVKDAVLRTLRRSYEYDYERMNNGSTAARLVGGKVVWAWYGSHKNLASDGDGSHGSSTTENILAWHVGTRLFEMKYSHPLSPTSASADMTAACHLSYYCAYLAAAAPELLPDSPAWTAKRYKEVVEDVRAALGKDSTSESTAQRYERLVQALGAGSRDKVLRRGAELGRRLVEEYAEDEASAWLFLANFWSEMVLFVAPSENVKGHVAAMARGGEFVTLVWALLLHAGITTRPETLGSAIP